MSRFSQIDTESIKDHILKCNNIYKDHELLLSFLNTDYDLNLKEDFLRLFQTLYFISPNKYPYLGCLQVEDKQLFMITFIDKIFEHKPNIKDRIECIGVYIRRMSVELWIEIMRDTKLNNNYSLIRPKYMNELVTSDLDSIYKACDDKFVIIKEFESKISTKHFYVCFYETLNMLSTTEHMLYRIEHIDISKEYSQIINDSMLSKNILYSRKLTFWEIFFEK